MIEAVDLAKGSAVAEFKAFEEYSENLTLEASRIYGEGFDLCEKQITLHFPDLDIDDMEIDPDLAEEIDEGEVDGDAILAKDPPFANQNPLGKKDTDHLQ